MFEVGLSQINLTAMKQKHHLVRRSIFTLVLMSNLLCAALYAQDPSQDGAASQLLSDAQSSLHRGDWATAASLLERVVENDPRNKSARAALVSTLMRINRIAEAEKQAASFALQFPNETEPVFLTALLAFHQGQMQRACSVAGRYGMAHAAEFGEFSLEVGDETPD